MEEKVFFGIPRDWVEPAHPAVVKLYEDMVAIYSLIREKCQKEIDGAFDSVSRQVGFVVTTTVPVVFNIGDKGVIKNIAMGSENLKGTLFDRELSAALRSLVDHPGPSPWKVAPGTYKIYLLWHDALSLKLRTEWMEPAHFLTQGLATEIQSELRAGLLGRIPRPGCEWCEPAHWFDPGTAIAVEDAVQIEAIDRVYPELRLVDRVAAIRAALRTQVGPGIREPAHPPTIESE